MDCMQATSPLREAGLRGKVGVYPAAGHQQNYQFPGFPPVEEELYAADRGGLLWENFSVDDLLDLGSGAEELSCGEEEEPLGIEDAEEEEEEEEDEEEEGERSGSPHESNASAPSAVSFQEPPPVSSDLVVPAGDVAELEWVSRFVDDSYSEFASSSVAPPFQNHSAPAPAFPAAAARGEGSKGRFSSSGAPLKRNWGSCFFFADSTVVPSKARSKRSRTGGRVWSLRRPPFLADSSSSAASCSVSSASSCSISSSSSSISPMVLYDGLTATLQGQQLQLKKKRGRKPKAAPAAADGTAAVAEQLPRRRCSHCGVDRTPQWRAGPMGAKTLCNACGVRYKSGRLLPEYRPAGSPTFRIHLHSNSHRKVLEMRRSKELLAVSPPFSCPTPVLPTPAAAAQLHGVV